MPEPVLSYQSYTAPSRASAFASLVLWLWVAANFCGGVFAALIGFGLLFAEDLAYESHTAGFHTMACVGCALASWAIFITPLAIGVHRRIPSTIRRAIAINRAIELFCFTLLLISAVVFALGITGVIPVSFLPRLASSLLLPSALLQAVTRGTRRILQNALPASTP